MQYNGFDKRPSNLFVNDCFSLIDKIIKHFHLFEPDYRDNGLNKTDVTDGRSKSLVMKYILSNTKKQSAQEMAYENYKRKVIAERKSRKYPEFFKCFAYCFIYFVVLFVFAICGAKHSMPFSRYHNNLVLIYSLIISVLVTPGFLKHFFGYMYSDVIPEEFKTKPKPKLKKKIGFFDLYVRPIRGELSGSWNESTDVTKPIALVMAFFFIMIGFSFHIIFVTSINSALAFLKPINRYVKVEAAEPGKYEISDWREPGKTVKFEVDKNKPVVATRGDIMLIETRVGFLGLEYLNDQDSLECFDIKEFPEGTKFPLTEEEFQKVHTGKKYKSFRKG